MPVDTIITRWASQGLSQFIGDLKRAEGAAGGVESRLAKMEKVGNGLTIGGAAITGASLATRNYIKSAIELGNYADNTALKLKQMLEVRGQGSAFEDLTALAGEMQRATGNSDETFKEASVHLLSFGLNAKQIRDIMPGISGQALTLGSSIDSVADSFGRAFASGKIGGLTRSGVVLSQADKDAIDYAKSVSEAAGQQEIFNRVLQSYNKYALKAGQGITEAARAQNYFNQVKGDAEERFGSGAAGAQTKMYQEGAKLLDALNTKPKLLEMAGAVATYGSALGSVAGPIATATGLMMKLKAAKQLATIAQNLETNAERNKIPVALEEAAAHEAATVAVTEHALANEALAATGGGAGVGGVGGGVGGLGGAAGKIGIGAQLLNFLKMPAMVGGRGASTAAAFGEGGAAVTMGGAALSIGLGVGAGVQAAGNMQAAGYSQGQSYWYGAATGLGAAAVSAFVPGGPVWVALGMAAAAGANKLINEPQERAAEAGTGADNVDVMGNDLEARRQAAQAQGNATKNWKSLADVYAEMASKAYANGDEESAVNFQKQAEGFRRRTRKMQNPTSDWSISAALEKQRNDSLEWQAANKPEFDAMQAKYRREMEAKGVRYDNGAISNIGAVNRNVDNGIVDPRAGAVKSNRDGSRSVTIHLPESRGDVHARKANYNTRTPSPNYVN